MAIRPRPAPAPTTPNTSVAAYVVLERTAALFTSYTLPSAATAMAQVRAFIANNLPAVGAINVVGLPGRPMFEPGNPATAPIIAAVKFLVVQIRVSKAKLEQLSSLANPSTGLLRGVGRDVPVSASGHWCPGISGGMAFSTREAAENLIGKKSLVKGKNKLTGDGVQVVLFDSGLDAGERQILGLETSPLIYKGWQHLLYAAQAPTPPRLGHAYLTATHLKAIAPGVTVHDYALLPPSLSKAVVPSMQVNVPALISEITQAYAWLFAQINTAPAKNKSWVIINAWAIYRREWLPGTDIDAENHFMGWLISQMTTMPGKRVDVIFASGNCGQFSSDPRCHGPDKGEGLSVIGPAGYSTVLTVGSVRADGLWVGSSGQGPSTTGKPNNAPLLRQNKPDIAAPSQFFDLAQPNHQFSGTSTACAITGAVVAALREGWDGNGHDIKQAMIAGARKTLGSGWNARIGHGILDIKGTVQNL
jgi:Subtilase family